MRTLAGRGEWAGVEAAPDAVTRAGDEAVKGIGKDGGDKAQNDGYGRPGSGQFAEGGKDGAGADEDLRIG